MNIVSITAQLKHERQRLDTAIQALEGIDQPQERTVRRRTKHKLSPAGRRRLSEMMKKRWAQTKRKGNTRLAAISGGRAA